MALPEKKSNKLWVWKAWDRGSGRLYAGKEETHGIERDHARQRHWLARFRRRSIVVSKAVRLFDASIALFAIDSAAVYRQQRQDR